MTILLAKNWNSLIKPAKVQYKSVDNNPNIKTMIVEPLERGLGLTLGNSLRRVLLSSLRGAAITSIKIPGVEHELSPVSGVKEDLTDIILNLRGIIVKMDSVQKCNLRLEVLGPAVVTAGMITVADKQDVMILNPQHVICNLDKGFNLEMDLVCEQGKGYVPANPCSMESSIGVIRLDALFNPIKKVSYKVENSMVGQVTNYDKLIITVETNGVVNPDVALGLAARILLDQLQVFINFQEVEEEKPEKEELQTINPILLKKVYELELSVRSQNCLKNENIVYVGDLVARTENQMLKTANFGRKSLNELKKILANFNLEFGMKDIGWPPEKLESLAKKHEEQY
ncbi:DNA-directed RNA polymerase, alpha subunit [Orientia chuto str. Dubai]|uniref:DNA-directed RNA polymerase subunit alpha n=1 Tax=Orientia chuto str. Dubai TaxID=1359168 RepID=A0A0F3MKZ0_9RICK|nr:DNA-directed RNA polymerase subunit alpha [Candidatus Orientia mediorientalis]KJV55259.1 DNA-directed RNA polymerase, alpha subunit [Orientia chuto str. Dubai]